MNKNIIINLSILAVCVCVFAGFRKPLLDVLNRQKADVKEKSKAVALGYFLPDFRQLAAVAGRDNEAEIADLPKYISYYTKAHEIFPHLNNTPAFLGYFYSRNNNLDTGLEHYKKALEANPHYFWNYYNLALVYQRLGLYKESNAMASQALSKRPDIALMVINKAPEFRQIWRYADNAQEMISGNLRKGFEDCLAIIAANYFLLGDYGQVLKVSAQALQAGFHRKDLYLYYAGVSAYELEQHETVVVFLQQFVKSRPDNYQGWFFLGKALEALDKEEIARNALSRAKFLKTQNPGFKEQHLQLPFRIF